MSDSQTDRMREAYESFNRQDFETTMSAFDENIEWTEPEWTYGPSVGTVHGRNQVLDKVFATIPDQFDSFQLEPREFYHDGDTIIVEGSFRVRPKGSGRECDVPFTHVWKLRGDKAIKMRNYIDVRDVYALVEQRRAA